MSEVIEIVVVTLADCSEGELDDDQSFKAWRTYTLDRQLLSAAIV